MHVIIHVDFSIHPVLGGFITPAGCMKPSLELSILLCCRHYTFPIPLIVVVSLFTNGVV